MAADHFDSLRLLVLLVVLGVVVLGSITASKAVAMTTHIVRVLLGAIVVGLVAVLLLPTGDTLAWVPLELIAMGLLAVGTILGFLFGLPKTLDVPSRTDQTTVVASTVGATGSTSTSTTDVVAQPKIGAQPGGFVRFLQSNNNLQKVSDWLTTVITGLTLTQLLRIPGYVSTFGHFIQDAVGGLQYGVAIGAGLLLYFPTAGFAAGYLITRLVLATELDRAERTLAEGDQRQVADATNREFGIFSVIPFKPTADQIEAAQRISQVPLSSLTTAEQKATWARAQSILRNWSNAVIAFQQAIAITPDDAELLEDYADALYEADASPADVVAVLERALKSATVPAAEARIMANITLAYLDARDYDKAFANIDKLLTDANLPKRARYFLYRARANGGRWASCVAATPNDPRLAQIADAILADVRLAIELEPTLIEKVRDAAKPASADTLAGDLAAFAAQNQNFRALIGM